MSHFVGPPIYDKYGSWRISKWIKKYLDHRKQNNCNASDRKETKIKVLSRGCLLVFRFVVYCTIFTGCVGIVFAHGVLLAHWAGHYGLP